MLAAGRSMTDAMHTPSGRRVVVGKSARRRCRARIDRSIDTDAKKVGAKNTEPGIPANGWMQMTYIVTGAPDLIGSNSSKRSTSAAISDIVGSIT